MKKISTKTEKELDELLRTLRDAQQAYNEKAEAIREIFEDSLRELTELRDTAENARVDLREKTVEIHEDIEAYCDERSELWHDTEKGEAYSEWLSAWEYATDEIEHIVELEAPNIEEIEEVTGEASEDLPPLDIAEYL
jgi:uncharacterized protein YukE